MYIKVYTLLAITMRKIVKRKTIILITFGILFTLSLLISNNLNYNEGNREKITDNDILKISIVSGPIHIDDIDPSINWSVAEAAGICTGKGTYSEPYVIEDLVIDGGALGSGVLIENSDVFFRIENCTIYNSGVAHSKDGGIELYRVSNGTIIENNCSNNKQYGIVVDWFCYNNTVIGNIIADNGKDGVYFINCFDNNIIRDNVIYGNGDDGIALYASYNNIIIENNVSDSKFYGIKMVHCQNNSILGNTVNHNQEYGIYFDRCYNNTILSNTVNYNQDSGIVVEDNCHNINISGNTVNNNTYYGIKINYYSTLNTISGNTVNYNTRGIGLVDSSYNKVLENTVNYNNNSGITIGNSHNNTILGNTANYNDNSGISLDDSHNHNISGNTANYNTRGIFLERSNDNTILENIMDECGLVISHSFEELSPNNIDTSNLVNGKPLYFYTNEINLGLSNFTNAGQVILVNCRDSLISNLNVSYGSVGISLFYCNNNNISGNIANYNKEHGIYLYYSNNNLISGNTLIGNDECWKEEYCENNSFENNDCGNYQPPIPGYNVLLIIGVVSIVSVIIMKKLKPK